MNHKVTEYSELLMQMEIDKTAIHQAEQLIDSIPQLTEFFSDPTISLESKHSAIKKVFPSEIRKFLMLLCDNGDFAYFSDIVKQEFKRAKTSTDELRCELRYVTKPSDNQLERMKKFIAREHQISNADSIQIELVYDKELMGGFVLRVDNAEYDWSVKNRLEQVRSAIIADDRLKDYDLRSLSGNEIISILKSEIDDSHFDESLHEVGVVTRIGDGIVNIDGLDHAMYGEIVIFENGVRGMVQDIKRESIGCILFGRDNELKEGDKVIRTGRRAGIGVGSAYIGRIVDALGAPIDGRGEILAEGYRAIEEDAPSIVDRQSVNQPLETGILAIDSMFPIGKGQRELIIGDRQTGKTSIAIDTIINQKGKNVICIYVAIGQKASTLSKIVSTLNKHDSMEYTMIVSAAASDPASLQYIAPYSGTALAEYFMYQGRDVLIIYDDLSKHAVAYRALSLLLERSPGREAYPGDVFYLHSRLLERSSRLRQELGGGSITALPIIETQAGDVSAYIPTNVISITDGQIFLESDLFFEGQRPAVNVGLSVSRVGGAAQTKAMKKASGSIRIDLAQYREMEIFTQFSSDLDEDTKAQLQYGNTLMELLKQPLYRPLTQAEQVITLCAATERRFVDIPLNSIKKTQMELLDYMDSSYPRIMTELTEKKILSEELRHAISEALDVFFAGILQADGKDENEEFTGNKEE